MNRLWAPSLLLLALVPGASSAAGRQGVMALPAQQAAVRPSAIPNERFNGMTALRTKRGGLKELHVVVRNWMIHGRQRIRRFPVQGFTVVQLHAGKVVTTIDGKEESRSAGDFWTVPVGSTMTVRVSSESASLETMAVRRP